STGENTNCIKAKTTAKRALHVAASVIRPPRKSRISFGKTGIIKPIARMSRVTVTRMKMTAAGRDFIARTTTVEAAVSAAKFKCAGNTPGTTGEGATPKRTRRSTQRPSGKAAYSGNAFYLAY